MKDTERRTAAKAFAEYWKDRGYEKGESQPFWLSLLRDVLGVESPEKFITFEEQVRLDHTSFIDGFIPSTHVLIEQKGRNKDLRKPIKQSDGTLLTPFQQAQRYSAVLPYSQRPRWIITCNFVELLVYDMEKPNGEPEQILIKDLEKEYYRLMFLVDTGDENIRREMEVSIQAGNLVGILYDEILKQYHDPENQETLKSLNKLIVRLVFCLYAEDAGIFGGHSKFHNYIKSFSARDMRKALIELFKILDTKPDDRDPYEDEQLSSFPYVNGGLFADEYIEIPQMNDAIRELLLHDASENFDWSNISPTIFGAVFESTLNPETRRSGGMHYTSIENIHKVIDPLFLDELREELEEIKSIKVTKTKEAKLNEFRKKLGSLTFFDPACGSGNFLTETYISLRRLENEALEEITQGQMLFDFGDVIHVNISQFYGIEINDFAVTVAKTALWIAESQMMKETEDIIHKDLEFLPLKTNAHIVEGNALRIDWETVVPKDKLNYIMGNPPFVGMKEQTTDNKKDMQLVVPLKKFKQLDYVACWYFKASDFIEGTFIEVAFVSSNSIVQGEQALTIWKYLFENQKIIINFAYNTFKWSSESKNSAAVHCVIIGFSKIPHSEKHLYNDTKVLKCFNINQYLAPSDNIFIEKSGKPICDVQIMTKGAQLIDGGNFVVGGKAEYENVISKEPNISKYIRRYFNAKDLLNNGEDKYVLYLEDCSPHEIKNSSFINSRVRAVYDFRANNESPSTNVLKDTPSRYFQSQVPHGKSVVVPVVSSVNRRYIPICFMPEGMVYTNALFFIDDATTYTFGILTSNVHMAWMRTVCGRLKSDYRYSNTMVYNTFPWPTPTAEQKANIEKTAQAILDARAKYPDCSLADLYDEVAMPPELRKAHQANDKAVMQAYGFWGKLNTESECVAELMRMYQELTK
ncbi:MAG: N-6 DNA methylase [Clostridia bacterium]|nr:N-6 DNA methylase [Clostridia bacterium]